MAIKTVRTQPFALTDPSGESIFNEVMAYATLLKPGLVLDMNSAETPEEEEPEDHVQVLKARVGTDVGVTFQSREVHDLESNQTTKSTIEAATFGMPGGQSALIRYDTNWDNGNRSYIELQVDAPDATQKKIIEHFQENFAAPSDREIDKQKKAMQEALKAQQWGSTQDYATELLVWRPDDPEILQALGTSMIISNQMDQAEKVMNRLLEVQPDNYAAHMNLASVWMSRQNYDKAIEHYQAIVDLQPDKDFAPFILATAYESKGDTKKARELYEQVLKLKRSPGPTNYHDLAKEAIANLKG